ncbi:MAG: dihydrolipoamide acetyltransferase [bacterium]
MPKAQQSYSIKLRELAERVSTLKELVSQTKIRLNLLKESVLGETTAGSELVIIQDNQMGGSFRLVAFRYLLDGKQLEAKTSLTEKDSERGTRNIYAGPAMDGVHILTVEFVFRGHGFGVFSYLRGYRYRIRSSYRFKASVGTGTTVRVIPFERGSAFTPLKQRLSVRYEKKVSTLAIKRDSKGRAKTAPSKNK